MIEDAFIKSNLSINNLIKEGELFNIQYIWNIKESSILQSIMYFKKILRNLQKYLSLGLGNFRKSKNVDKIIIDLPDSKKLIAEKLRNNDSSLASNLAHIRKLLLLFCGIFLIIKGREIENIPYRIIEILKSEEVTNNLKNLSAYNYKYQLFNMSLDSTLKNSVSCNRSNANLDSTEVSCLKRKGYSSNHVNPYKGENTCISPLKEKLHDLCKTEVLA